MTMLTTGLLDQINIKCEDNRSEFKDRLKTGRIDRIIRKTNFRIIHDGKLTKLYSRVPAEKLRGVNAVLVSSHIDTVYRSFYHKSGDDVIIGTLDNSITNAVLLEILLTRSLPENVIIAFTGNEEKESLGVDETVNFLNGIKVSTDMVISLDVTAVGYRNYPYTVESYFVRRGRNKIFDTKKQLKGYILRTLENKKTKTIHHISADPDDTWQFDEHDLNCFSFCLPVRGIALHDDWMHDDIGIITKKKSVKLYREALLKLMRKISSDLR